VSSLSRGSFADQYYDYAWSKIASTISPDDEERIENTLSLIPTDCSSILDIGCGDGRVTNRLTTRYVRVVGLDNSIEALRYLRASAILGNIEHLPFPDKTFDLVLCSEVLEHLPFSVYSKALAEIERVAAKYIIITVPNNEDLRESSTVCPACSCRFHPSRHVRSFDVRGIKGLFRQFNPPTLTKSPTTKVYPKTMIRAARILGVIPQETRTPFPPTALCPQCGYIAESTNSQNSPQLEGTKGLLNFVLPLARVLVPKIQRAIFIIALYQRRGDSEHDSKG
jgi:SAM-dependent methyltransferase